MHHLGFNTTWSKGVSGLYRNAHSHVLLAGGVGPRFNITRSVRKGCLLAPFLFLLFAEAMLLYISSQSMGPSRGHIQIPSKFLEDIMGQETRYENKRLPMASNT